VEETLHSSTGQLPILLNSMFIELARVPMSAMGQVDQWRTEAYSIQNLVRKRR
jgi:hypothetical protein